MQNKKPDVFQYTNFKEFLKNTYLYFKSIDSKYSHRFIAKEMLSGSCGWFSDVLQGRLKLTSTNCIRLAKIFKLTEKQREYFETIVQYAQADSFEEKELCYKKMLSFKELKPVVVNRDQFSFFRKWYIPAIRELLFIFDFKDDYKALAQKMNPAIKPKEAKDAIEVLLSCGLIERKENGYYKPCAPIIQKDPSFASFYWALYMKSNISLALESVHRYNKEERDISSSTFAFSKESLQYARGKIKELRHLLLKISEEDSRRDVIYQFNIQLFPLTKNTMEHLHEEQQV